MNASSDRYAIVGGGPAGLIMARALRKAEVPFDVFERHTDVGGIWDPENPGSPMYDSAHFISSKHTSYFYGYPMPASYPDYPSHRQILDYVREFASAYGLYGAVTLATEVERAEREGDGWRLELASGEERKYRGLICANGVTWHPAMPEYPGLDSFAGEIRHSSTYRSPSELVGRRVLIVGSGNSGVDIACDAARVADRALLSMRRGYRFVPKHIFGVPTDVFINEGGEFPAGVTLPEDVSELLDVLVGDLTRLGLPAPDHPALSSHPIVNSEVLHHISHGDLHPKPDVAEFAGDRVRFADGSEDDVDLVLLATGFRWRVPYVAEDLWQWSQGHPELYMSVFHRTIEGLYAIGFVEFADAAYKRFDEMAQLIVGDIMAGGEAKERLTELRANHRPDLRGPMEYIDSPRHASYVEVHTYMEAMAALREEFGWPVPDDAFYEDLRAAAAA